MANYKLVSENKKHYIREVNSNLIVSDMFKEYNKARKFIKKLNSGLAFNGWTPPFFLIKQTKR